MNREPAGAAPPTTSTLTRFDRDLVLRSASWCGRLRGVYRHAAMAWPDDGGAAITLVHPSRPLVPYGVVIPWDSVSLEEELPVVLVDGTLRVGRSAFRLGGDGASLRLDRGRDEPGRGEPGRADSGEAGSGRAPGSLAHLRQQLAAVPVDERARALLGRRAPDGDGLAAQEVAIGAERLETLVAVMRVGAPRRLAQEAVTRLVGLGTGSTPTGDDLVTGLTAAAVRFSELGWFSLGTAERLQAAIGVLPERATTPVGREMLGHAARGAFPAALVAFVEGLGDPNVAPHLSAERAEALSRVGATSGVDMMAGVIALADHVAQPVGAG